MTGPQRHALEHLRYAVQAARDGCTARDRGLGHPGGARRVLEALRALERATLTPETTNPPGKGGLGPS